MVKKKPIKKEESKFSKPIDMGVPPTDITCQKCGEINTFGGELYGRPIGATLKCRKCGTPVA